MTRKEEIQKIHELIKKYAPSASMGDFGNKELLFTELLDWHKKQVIEKASKWLVTNADNYVYADCDSRMPKIDADYMVETFKKAMEE